MSFREKVQRRWMEADTLVCVGLDPDLERITRALSAAGDRAASGSLGEALFTFNRRIIEATADLAAVFKPQIAHYAACGEEGLRALRHTIRWVHEHHPDVPVILDAKRNDIGSTAERYAVEVFDRYGADAVTVSPYLGGDSLAPFLERADRSVFVLCRTSNPGARDLQDLPVAPEGTPLYQVVARLAAGEWNTHGNVGLVMGATYPEELRAVRDLVGDMPFLVPGVGAQGGDVAAAVRSGQDSRGAGLLINSSRGILYASAGADFAEAARRAAGELREAINVWRREG
ncbi:MAG: orotidine-5'-phosphate decarboxylase [Armatimonadetes bacterium]|nr:orotidine-5'-phosphate decarboxylase [Armatimonadota bacterium]